MQIQSICFEESYSRLGGIKGQSVIDMFFLFVYRRAVLGSGQESSVSHASVSIIVTIV